VLEYQWDATSRSRHPRLLSLLEDVEAAGKVDERRL
jgi:hypothetical protein